MAGNQEQGKGEPVAAAIDGPSSFYYILLKASDVDGFLSWIRDYHHIDESSGLLSGYKFLLGSIFKCLMNGIHTNTSLELSEDEVYFRAQFVGVPLRNTPNTCEKTVLLKRIWIHGKAVSKAQTWQQLQDAIAEAKSDLDIFRRLPQDHSRPAVSFDKEYVIQSLACDHVFTFLNDTSHNIPLAELVFPSIEHTATKEYLFDAFPGYVYGLQYLWYSIIGSDEFGRTCVRELHLALDQEEVKKHPRPKSNFEEMLEHGEKFGFFKAKEVNEADVSEEAKDFIEGAKRDMVPRSERWGALDRFYRHIQREIVHPREVKLQVALGMSHILVLEGYHKDLLKDLIDSSRVEEPEYLSKTDRDSKKKLLELEMLWYEVNVLDTQSLLVFNGVPAFASTLLGSVELAKAFRRGEQVKVIVFKHPAWPEGKFDYSYALLIDAFGWGGISDYSGWLVFFDCATDHSGFGGSLHSFANTAIELARKKGQVSLREVVVEKDLFREYLKEHSVSSVFDALIKETPGGTKDQGSITSIQTEVGSFVAHAKGKLVEHLVHKWVGDSGRFEKTGCDIQVNGEQIDCMGEIGRTTSFYECKLNVHQDTIDATIEQIIRKSNILTRENWKVYAWLVVYGMIPADTKVAFEKKGISVLDNFRNIIVEQRCFDGTRKELLEILDWQFQISGKLRPEF